MNVFWRDNPLSVEQSKLLDLVLQAHDRCARRNNISTVTLRNTAIGNGAFSNALAAALCTVGGVHAPLLQTHHVLATFNPDDVGAFVRHIEMGGLVPGWGSDFVKGAPDDTFVDIDALLATQWPKVHGTIRRITDELHAHGKTVWPNMACYSAAAAIALELPAPLLAWLFVQGRLNAWACDFYNTLASHEARQKK